jgi:GNAT superfamily N-acetyltransferase
MSALKTEQRNVLIRPAKVQDCEALTDLMLRSSAYDGRYRRMIENYPVTPAMIGRNEVWTAELHRRIVGFYRLDVANADLDLMFVDDSVQGRGVGAALFEHMKSVARTSGLGQVQIVAHPPAADFYRRMGAVDVGVSKAPTTEGWDRPILKLAIES